LAVQSISASQVVEMVESYTDAAVLTVAGVTDEPLAAEQLGRYLREFRYLSPELNGRDLLALGVPEGPVIGKLLKELRNAKLDGKISTVEDERRMAQEFLAQGERFGNE
jgi:tRNA nucleotidyltransferase (CCA-adding enzyme)